jgi:hypothetical protein
MGSRGDSQPTEDTMSKSDKHPKGKSTVKVKDLSPKDGKRVKGGDAADRPAESLRLKN